MKLTVLLVSLAIAAAKKAPEVVPPPSALMSALLEFKAFLLFEGSYWWMFHLTCGGLCAANALTILKATPNIKFFHGLVLLVFNSYGGSTLSAVACGLPVVFMVNQALVTIATIVWCAMFVVPGLPAFLETSMGCVTKSFLYEVQRCHVSMNCAKMAAGALASKVSATYPVPAIGPLVCGTLGGCGGGFFPLTKGFDPLSTPLNWRIQSAFIGSLWLQFVFRDPNTAPYFTGMLPFLKEETWIRFILVLFYMTVPMLQAAMPGFNPFGVNPIAGAAKAPAKAAVDKKTK